MLGKAKQPWLASERLPCSRAYGVELMRKVTCPFSQQACRDCPLFRGRHYRCPFHKTFDPGKEYTSWRAGKVTWEMPDAPNPNPAWFVAPDIDGDVEWDVQRKDQRQ